MNAKRRTVVLGCVFAFFLFFGYFENVLFLSCVRYVFTNPIFAVAMVFVHNVAVVSLIILGMSFYVEFVSSFLPKRNIEYAVLNHPRLFAVIFTIILLTISFFRIAALLTGQIIGIAGILMLISLPHGIVEAYGIYTSIHKTLKKTLTSKALLLIYLVFMFAAILEVGLTQALI